MQHLTIKNEIFVRIDMKHSYFSIFSVVETVVVSQKIIHVYAKNFFLLYKEISSNKSNFVYVLVHRNILMYVILACHLFMLMCIKNYTCSNFV